MTRPLPKTRSPVLKKNKKILPVSADTPPKIAGAGARLLVGRALAAGAGSGAGASAGGGAKSTVPSAPAIRKSTVSSRSTTSVMAQETTKKSQAIQSFRKVFRPRFQHALRIRDT